jgi:aminoglycoside phosphotransferase (APT) family kinase protein
MVTPARPLASGRDSDVYAHGDGRVLRRYRDGRTAEHEAATMRILADAGYPVPAVHAAEGPDLVMDRVDGPTMAAALLSGAVGAADAARALALLQDRLHTVPWPDAAPGESLLHLDLHPLNVLMGPTGPVVIDWSNARPGPAGLDVAMTALILAQVVVTPGMLGLPPELDAEARGLLEGFLAEYAVAVTTSYDEHLDAAEALRRRDPNMSPAELDLVTRAVSLARQQAGRRHGRCG